MAIGKKDLVIKYFKKVDNEITKINKSDDFKLRFLIALANGEINLSHQSRKASKIYRDDWLKNIEKVMPSIENIIYNPKRFIKQEEVLVPVELAKKTGKESIQHLLANTQFIDKYDDKTGDVRPNKILTINREEDFSIYENRFIKMLVMRLQSFVEHRYKFINDRINGVNQNIVSANMDVNFGEAQVKCKIEYEVSYEEEDENAFKSYRQIVSRIEMQRMSLFKIAESEFMSQLKNAKPIVGKIQRTNILTKDVNYSEALDLWEYIGHYEGVGFDVEVTQDVINFDDAYKDEMYNLIMLGYATTKYNIDRANQEYEDGFENKITRVKTLTPKIDKVFLEVDDDYIYEEEVLIPSKIELLKNIKEEQRRLSIELEKQNKLEAKAKARLAELRKLHAAKVKKQRAKEKALIKREQQRELKRIKQEENDKILFIVREKELKKKEINVRLKLQKNNVAAVDKEIEVYLKGIEKADAEEVKLQVQKDKENERTKHFKGLIKKEERVEASKESYYKALFKYNNIRSQISDLNILRREYRIKLEKLNKDLKKEEKIEKNIIKELEDI